jgi:hypothetical protein
MKPNRRPGDSSLLNEQFDRVFPKPVSLHDGESSVASRGGIVSEVYVRGS